MIRNVDWPDVKSRVYFIAAEDANDIPAVNRKLEILIRKSRVLDVIRKEHTVGVKAHFGEEGNAGFVRPEHVGLICREIAGRSASAFLSDTNTLYRGKRLNSEDHRAIAREHGFTKETVGIDIVIPDDTKESEVAEVRIDQKYVERASLARVFTQADAIVAVSHFKGHILTGFGGALKNLGMGCATRKGKLAQHCDVAPIVHVDKCAGCGECELVCPAGAIRIENGKAILDVALCNGCASCVAACPHMAMFIDFEAGDKLKDKMVEYSMAVLSGKKGRAAFFNFAVRITQECDCWGENNPVMAPDVGILASLDPVSIDRASYDLVNKKCGKDIFKAVHPKQDGMKQLKYAEKLGLGTLDYDLVEL